jgi:hypothetical protein
LSADWGSAGAISGPPQMKEPEEVNETQPAPRSPDRPRYEPLALESSQTLKTTKPATETRERTK